MTPNSESKLRILSEKKKCTSFNTDLEGSIEKNTKAKFSISKVELAENRSVSKRKNSLN
jgi:hypothetical protein